MEQTILPNETKLVKVGSSENIYTLSFADYYGNHTVWLPVSTAPVLIEHYSQKDYRDYPEAWGWEEVLIYDAGELCVTLIFQDGAYLDGVVAKVEVELLDLTPHIDTTWPA
jgi:hypothetical protein